MFRGNKWDMGNLLRWTNWQVPQIQWIFSTKVLFGANCFVHCLTGGIAQTLSAEIKENGGHVSVEDLDQYE